MKTPALILLALFALTTAHARIGETPAECIARYGEPIKIDKEKEQLFFRKSGMLIVASFFDGKCDMLGMRKAEQDIIGTPEKLSDNEIELLREANGGGRAWKKKEALSMHELWETEDGAISAQYEPLKSFFVIYTRECNERQQAATKAAEQEKLDGF